MSRQSTAIGAKAAKAPVLSDETYLEIPENVQLTFRIAGPGTRLGAYLLDLALRTIALYGVVMGIGVAFVAFDAGGLPLGIYFVVAFLAEWGYGCFFETVWSGQTPGKRAFHLRVIKTEGYAIGFHDAMLRNLLRAADFAPLFYAAGFLSSVSNPRFQRIGDLVAGTMVVREKRPELGGELEGLDAFEPLPPGAFQNRYRPSEKTFEIIERLFRRRFQLAPDRLDEIALVLAEPLGKRLASFADRKFAREQPSDFLFSVLRSRSSRRSPEGRGERESDPLSEAS
jgi:uncharacterized RDD family membrane protein YckC